MPKVTAHSPQAETAQQFEAVFLGQMFQLMLDNSGGPGEFSGGGYFNHAVDVNTSLRELRPV